MYKIFIWLSKSDTANFIKKSACIGSYLENYFSWTSYNLWI